MSDHKKTLQPEILSQYEPFSLIEEETLALLAKNIQIQAKATGDTLFCYGEQDLEEYFLHKGQILLAARDGKQLTVDAGTEKSYIALAHLRPRMYTATALTPIEYFSVNVAVLQELQQSSGVDRSKLSIQDIKRKAGDEGHALLYEFKQDLANGNFILPSLPEVALRIRELIDSDQSSVPDIAKLVNTDPAIAAKIIKIANSTLYRGITKYDNTIAAITRLGLLTTKQLVTSFALFGLFKSESDVFKKAMQDIWRNSIEVAANCFVLAKHISNFSPEEALLAGLLHNIGEIVVVSYAQQFAELATDESKLALMISCLKGEVGGIILEEWNFPQELIIATRYSSDWLRDNTQEFDLCDLVQVAQLIAFSDSDMQEPSAHLEPSTYPKSSTVPAFLRLSEQELTPELTMSIIQEAKEQISEMQKILSF